MAVEIDRALLDRRMLGGGFDDLSTWRTWIVVLKAAFGLPLDARERDTFAAVAGNRASPTQRVRETRCVAGRRSGKSRMAAAIAIYLALFQKYRLSAGERGMVLVIAGTVDQANTVFGYVRGFLEASPALAKEIANVRRYEIELKNGIVIAVHSNSFRTVRGRTLVACVFDEVSFWKDETSAAPDVEVYRAVLPALATTRGMLIGISTPYRKFGLLHQKHRDHFGINDDGVLVVQGASKVFNPSLDDIVIDAQRAADPTSASAEWDAEFRADIATFLNDELIDRAVEHDRPPELPPAEGVVYQAFTDPSGGVGSDSYTVAIGHKAGECPRSINAEPTGLGTRWRPPGVKLGGPKLAEVCRIGHRTQAEQADRFAANMRPVIEQIRKSGITSLRGIAAALNARGVPTARGGTLDAGPDHGN